MKVYISLPITGKDLQGQKSYARHVASFLSEAGFEPVNPFDNGLGEDASYEQHMKADILLMLGCGAVLLCDGWAQSRGCVLESHVAVACGMEVVDTSTPLDKVIERLKTKENESRRATLQRTVKAARCGSCRHFKDEDAYGQGWCEEYDAPARCGDECAGKRKQGNRRELPPDCQSKDAPKQKFQAVKHMESGRET